MNRNLHLSDDGEGAGSPSPNPALTPAIGAPSGGGALCGGPELRLLIEPVFDGHLTYKHDGQSHGGMRWVSENGHPGRCAADHRHSSPEAASACFHGLTQEKS